MPNADAEQIEKLKKSGHNLLAAEKPAVKKGFPSGLKPQQLKTSTVNLTAIKGSIGNLMGSKSNLRKGQGTMSKASLNRASSINLSKADKGSKMNIKDAKDSEISRIPSENLNYFSRYKFTPTIDIETLDSEE